MIETVAKGDTFIINSQLSIINFYRAYGATNRNLSFSQHPFAVLQGGVPGDFPEFIAEISLGSKATVGGDLTHGEVGGDQRRLGGCNAETQKPLGRGLPVGGGVKPVEVVGVQIKLLRQRLQRNGFFVMFPQVLVCQLQVFLVEQGVIAAFFNRQGTGTGDHTQDPADAAFHP